VVYLGFSLRDPDFLLLKDALANTYKGASREHYAVLPDVHEAEKPYWKKEYGINLYSYETKPLSNGLRDHSALCGVLRELKTESAVAVVNDENESAEVILLSLARHAARLSRADKKSPEFPLRVKRQERNHGREFWDRDPYDFARVEGILDDGPERLVLIGAPGAGKSYALAQATARLAEQLHSDVLASPPPTAITVPISVDLKLYQGNLRQLIESTLPKGLTLRRLSEKFKIRLLLDSFNEMPQQYLESGDYEADFVKLFGEISKSKIVIGSRTPDGLAKFEFPLYALDEIDGEFVSAQLEGMKVELKGKFAGEIKRLLGKPFYFQLFLSGKIELPLEPHPNVIYQSFFDGLTNSFESKFNARPDLIGLLAKVGYSAIDKGVEAFELGAVLDAAVAMLQACPVADANATDIVNWLVSQAVLVPYTGRRAAFFHQSATEYLAANELARLYQAAEDILQSKLRYARWDQAIFLTLAFLPGMSQPKFVEEVVKIDLPFAMRASKYVEFDSEVLVSMMLRRIAVREFEFSPTDGAVEFALREHLQVSDVHLPLLREILAKRNSTGGVAAICIARLSGSAIKQEFIELLELEREDYNFCANGIGPAISSFVIEADINVIARACERLDQIVHAIDQVPKGGAELRGTEDEHNAKDQESGNERENEDEEEDDARIQGFCSGSAKFLSRLGLDAVFAAFGGVVGCSASPTKMGVIEALMWDDRDHALWRVSLALIAAGNLKPLLALSLNAQNPPKAEIWNSITPELLNQIIAGISIKTYGRSAIEAIGMILEYRPDLISLASAAAEQLGGIEKAALRYEIRKDDGILFDEFDAMVQGRSRDFRRADLLSSADLNWEGRAELFVELLRLRDEGLAEALTGSFYMQQGEALAPLRMIPVDFFLEWLVSANNKERWGFRQGICTTLGRRSDDDTKDALLAEFNSTTSPYRRVLATEVLVHFSDISTDQFTMEAIEFLLAQLGDKTSWFRRGDILGIAATEAFVEEKLLPLVSETLSDAARKNVTKILVSAGQRHGRRYIANE
jgi:hypothetical protein